MTTKSIINPVTDRREFLRSAILATSALVAPGLIGLTPAYAQSTDIAVTNLDDSGPGSLREALQLANTLPSSRITFAIPGEGTRYIKPLSALPEITTQTVLDGRTQDGYDGRPIIQIDGIAATGSNGLVLGADASQIHGVSVTRFDGSGIVISANQCAVTGCHIGVDPLGLGGGWGNGQNGISVTGAENVIGAVGYDGLCVISGNDVYGVQIGGEDASHNRIINCYIGTSRSAMFKLPNGRTGVLVYNSGWNEIGGALAGELCVISGNDRGGITLDGSALSTNSPNYGTESAAYTGSGRCRYNRIINCYIGVTRTGYGDLGNTLRGVLIFYAQFNTIERCVISGNDKNGVDLLGPVSTANGAIVCANNRIMLCKIGVGPNAVSPIPNTFSGIFGSNARNNKIGGPNASYRNYIRHNRLWAIRLRGTGAATNAHSGMNNVYGNNGRTPEVYVS